MNWLRRLMIGRYGGDQLSVALMVLSIILTWISWLTSFTILTFIGYIPLCISVYRILSKDIQKRRMENYKFSMLMSPIYSSVLKVQSWAKESKTYKHFRCPSCKTKLRVPKLKKEIIITCPKCRTEFRKRA